MNDFISRFSVNLIRKAYTLGMPARERWSGVIASLSWRFLKKRRGVVLKNLALCLPEYSEADREALGKSLYHRLARSMLDHGTLWEGSQEEIRRFVSFEGLENLLENPDNQPTIIVCPHFVGLDAVGIALNTYVRGVSLYQKQTNAIWNEAFLSGRKRFSDPVLIEKSENDLRQVMREMKSGLPFFYLPDMDHGPRHSIFVPFFGVTAATLPMVSRLARVTKARVLWCIATMTPMGYHGIISKPLEGFPTADAEADTLRINQELESWIRCYPDQYYWVHRRFKTRPDGEPWLYDTPDD